MKIFLLVTLLFGQILAFDEVDEYLGLESKLEKDLVLYGEKHQWRVDPSKQDISSQTKYSKFESTIDWKNTTHKQWLSFNAWRESRESKDKTPHWKNIVRSVKNRENIGRVIKCIGTCRLFRGEGSFAVRSRSQIIEGDEVQTFKDSSVWIFLNDGGLVRLSSDTSMSFNEFNFTYGNMFFQARLNFGHVHLRPRHIGEYKLDKLEQTDQSFLPLPVMATNEEFFERKLYKGAGDINSYFHTKEPKEEMVKELNSLVRENQKMFKRINSVFHLSSANATVISTNMVIDFFYDFKKESFLKASKKEELLKKDDKRKQSLFFIGRDIRKKKIQSLVSDQWYRVNARGMEINEDEDMGRQFGPLKLLVKRIPSVLLARERFLRKYSGYLLENYTDEEDMFRKFGFRVWNKQDKTELKRRVEFLNNTVKRMEAALLYNIVDKNDEVTEVIPTSLYQKAFARTLLPLKKSYHLEKSNVKTYNKLDYKIWLQKNDEYNPR